MAGMGSLPVTTAPLTETAGGSGSDAVSSGDAFTPNGEFTARFELSSGDLYDSSKQLNKQ